MLSEALELAAVRRMARDGTARRIREDASVSRSELARDLRVHESTVQKWEAGQRSPRGRVALQYGRLLKELEGAEK
jgi:DNA-binding transcriptional regulator YiaG